MITDPTRDQLPFSMDDFPELIKIITKGFDHSTLTNVNSMKFEHIFDRRDTGEIDGFSVKLTLQLNEKGTIDKFVDQVVIYENEDEWLEAYQRITKEKEK